MFCVLAKTTGGYENNYLQQPGPGAYSNGYSAGISDAVYDHDNNLAYNPVGQFLSCHSQVYWDGFHHGYDENQPESNQWNSYISQSSTQGTSINIYGNNNYVNTAQNNGQSTNPENPGIGQGQGCCGWGGGPDP
jgi:hypothetical protein